MNRRRLLASGLGTSLGLLLARPSRLLANPDPSARACILLWLRGGPSQLDTFDPKPGTRTGGPTRAIATAVPGLRFAEHFPRLAQRAKRLAVVRSLTSKEGDHARASYLLHTGYVPTGTVRHPTWGSVVSAELESRADVPGFVSLGSDRPDPIGPGYRGAAHGPYQISRDDPLRQRAGLNTTRRKSRRDLFRALEQPFLKRTGTEAGRGAAYARASRFLEGPLRKALDLSKTPAALRKAYGENPLGEAVLRAARLVRRGVRCVEVTVDGWDDHQDIFGRLPNRCRQLDAAFGALLDDLAGRDLLRSTLVVCMGEFGRTPDINDRGGRDHYPRAFSAVLAGGGVPGGRVVGRTSSDGRQVVARPVGVPDLFATLATRMGMDPKSVRYAGERPIPLVDKGKPIRELLPG